MAVRANGKMADGDETPAMAAQQQEQQQQQQQQQLRHKRWTDSGLPVTIALKVNNTLSGTKVLFKTKDGSKAVTWYNCGPTVYDSAHVGHARNYLTFDIIRRILEEYFGYNVFYVMNITDVDDKIIIRARRNHLLANYREEKAKDPDQVSTDIRRAVGREYRKQSGKVHEIQQELGVSTSSQQKKELTEKLKQEEVKLSKIQDVTPAFDDNLKEAWTLFNRGGDWVDALLSDSAADALASFLDSQEGGKVTDHAIFRAHSSRYEKEFFEDMASLNVRPPDVVTRVTEYVDVIIKYVETIINEGFAYHANGSVYFDTKAFMDAGHIYGKLNPWAVGSAGLAGESEANFENSDKKCGSDFALWKVSKPGEPFWDSPWGRGRPGWHIECSAMASDVIGETIDVHSGGNDLKFPHHDNELAQAEAFHGCDQWVNYFIHSGHLAIDGLKMSKSLKNYITIRQALDKYTARQLRLLFVGQAWDKPMTFSDAAMETSRMQEKRFDAFFDSVKGIIRQSIALEKGRWSIEEQSLRTTFNKATFEVNDRLEDNFDTAGALDVLLHLVRDVKFYCEKTVQSGNRPQVGLVKKVAVYVTHILAVFGFSNAPRGEIGWGLASTDGVGQSSKEEMVAPYLDALVTLKDAVREFALKLPPGHKEELLALGDDFRDHTMADIGVRLEDRVPGSSDVGWKIMDPQLLKTEREEKLRKAREERVTKLEARRERQIKDIAKWEAAAVDPVDLFKARTEEFSAFGADGIPTRDGKGSELTTSAKKKVKKEMDTARKANESLTQKLAKDPTFLETLNLDLKDIEDQISKLKS